MTALAQLRSQRNGLGLDIDQVEFIVMAGVVTKRTLAGRAPALKNDCAFGSNSPAF
jgi:hypothetical protein